MSEKDISPLRQGVRNLMTGLRAGIDVLRQNGASEIGFWFLALGVGIVSGVAAIGFRYAVEKLQSLAYGSDDLAHLHTIAARLDWWIVLCLPILGGLIVGIILQRTTSDGRVSSVADVIEASALKDGQLDIRRGVGSTLASWITLSTGGSTGREGPVVLLAGVLSTLVNRWAKLDGVRARDLLGCAVAAAVSASFNAPIAGALFALEVVLRHFAVHAFAPIVIASVSGTVISRMAYGNLTEFTLPVQNQLAFYVELPAYMILGILCGFVAALLMWSIQWAEDVASHYQKKIGLPAFARPAVAGAILGIIAIYFPHIIGVGYETTSAALTGTFTVMTAITFVVVKGIAVAVTMGGRMGGGVFSPSLMMGALSGLAFGGIATAIFPDMSGSITLYALAGMGAVAAAVLGAPISTTLIVFELTGDWQTGLAVMVSVSLSSALASRLVDKSFFLSQLERRNIHLAAGPQAYLLSTFRVSSVMRSMQHPRAATVEDCEELIAEGTYVFSDVSLDQAMPILEASSAGFVPVVRPSADGAPELRGALFHVDALRAFNRALAATAAEEHS